ncbi:MAG: histidine phosphatase family protein [Kaiparowitsia implicata GSE-PSE-MK54-09C]|nr:histidine phosphatase family protein [Kaiparowitsia implicata GSE-PSE-MK54-09C]
MNVLKFLFVRHAESVGNVQRRMQGWGEFDLSEQGRSQAQTLAQTLEQESWYPSHCYASPLLRAVQTAQILARVGSALDRAAHSGIAQSAIPGASVSPSPLPITLMDDLAEHQNGVLQGLTWVEAKARYPALTAQLETSIDWIPIPNAETLEQGRSRAQRCIATLLNQHQNGDRLLIVTHGWILQHLIASLLGCDRTWQFPTDNTARFELWIDRDRWDDSPPAQWNSSLWQIRRFNDTQHLQNHPKSLQSIQNSRQVTL